jgi:organic hydroperoxide reductase OsmC/OhrA
MTTTMQKEVTMMNGMSMTEMKAKMEAMAADPAMGQTTWRVESRWVGGCRTDHRVEALRIGGQEVMRPFMMQIDEPMELGGTNQFANPQEYLMAAINACMMVGCVAVASMMGIRLTKLEVEIPRDR